MSSTDLVIFTNKIKEINISNYKGSQSDEDFRTEVEKINRLIENYRNLHNNVLSLEFAFIRHVTQILIEYLNILNKIKTYEEMNNIQGSDNSLMRMVRIDDKDINIIDYNKLSNDRDKKYVERIVKVLEFLSCIKLDLHAFIGSRINVDNTTEIIDSFNIKSYHDLKFFTIESVSDRKGVGGIRKNRIRKTSKKNKKRRKSYIRRRRRS
jgi:hypothetical protein